MDDINNNSLSLISEKYHFFHIYKSSELFIVLCSLQIASTFQDKRYTIWKITTVIISLRKSFLKSYSFMIMKPDLCLNEDSHMLNDKKISSEI